MKFKLPLWLKFFVSIGLLYFLLKDTDWLATWQLVASVPAGLIILIILASFWSIFVNNYRWAIIIPIPLYWHSVKPLLAASFLGGFYSVFLPSALGGDLIKWGLTRHLGIPTSRLASSIVIDRVIGLIVSNLLSLLALVWLFNFRSNPPPPLVIQAVGGVSLTILIGAISWYLLARLSPRFLSKLPLVSKLKPAELLHLSARQLVLALIISALNQLLAVVCAYLLVGTLGVNLNFAELLLVIQLTALISSLPISFGGFGTSELGFVYLAQLLGANPNPLTAYISLNLSLRLTSLIVSGAIGWGLKSRS